MARTSWGRSVMPSAWASRSIRAWTRRMLKNSDFCDDVEPRPHHRPVAHHVVLDRRLDPPDGIGREAHAPVGVELVRGLHQTQRRFLDQVVHRRAIAAELARHRDREPHVSGDEPVQRALVPVIAPRIGELQLRVRVQSSAFIAVRERC
jgi:hypothetical protein